MNKSTFIKSRRLLIALTLVIATVIPAAAQFRIGPRVGMEVSSLKFDNEVFDSSNRTGFTGGLQFEFTVPIIGIGMDASVMYARRDLSYSVMNANNQSSKLTTKREYLDIPVNLKYKLSLPLVQNIVKPYIFTGPDFAFLTSGRGVNEAWRSKKFDLSWNFGLGVELINHLQVSANYGLGISKCTEMYDEAGQSTDVDVHNRTWTISAAWLF